MITAIVSVLLAGQGSAPFHADLGSASLNLHFVPSGAMPKVGFYYPQRLGLNSGPPLGAKNVPEGAIGFGTWTFGGKNVHIIELGSGGVPSKLLVDSSGSSDFAQADSYDWKAAPADPRKPQGFKLYRAQVKLRAIIGGSAPVEVAFYRFDPTDPSRAAYKSTLLYYADYGWEGTAKIGGKEYRAMLIDAGANGNFDGPNNVGGPKGPATKMLLIDRNGDGRFQPQTEAFDATKPFNIDGTTYAVTALYASGRNASLAKSGRMVAEIPVAPSLGIGKRAVSFTATDTSGKTVHFPQDFKGKVVLLDFWATWCGPCMGEVPTVVKVYNELHPKGFEILGISLDNAQTLKNIGPVTKDKGMTWDQVADGKYWDAAIGKLYGVQAIPQAYIVDGDTGMIYAEGEAIRGDNLLPAIQKALGAKRNAPK